MTMNVRRWMPWAFSTILVFLLASCAAKVKPLDASYVRTEPQPLELKGGKVPVTIHINFPDKWFPKNATMRITPVLKFAKGERWGTEYRFQGEKVRGNATTVTYNNPRSATLHSDFVYKPEMAVSTLVLMIEAEIGHKQIKLADIKIGEGVLSTEALASAEYSSPAIAPDIFQRVIKEKYDADIHFLIQQANIRGSELNKMDVKEWKNVVESANTTPNQRVNVEVQAYASPDGGIELNEKLAAQREKNTTKELKREFKKTNTDVEVDAHYTAQDWEGFKELLEKSDIQDKEIVLRVLSMYDDPEVREREIKNISYVFGQLADEILPLLRRSRLVANVEIIGKSDEEIAKLAKERPGMLNLEELLYAATLTNDISRQRAIYTSATQVSPNEPRAYNNLGALAYKEGNYALAKQYFEKAQSIDRANNIVTPETMMNMGLIKMLEGDDNEAQTLIGQVSGVPELNEALGLIYIKQGKYPEAAKALYDARTNNGILAQILNKDYNRALELFDMTTKRDEMTYYLQALIGARTSQTDIIQKGITEAVKINPSIAPTILKDKEFARYATQRFFLDALQ